MITMFHGQGLSVINQLSYHLVQPSLLPVLQLVVEGHEVGNLDRALEGDLLVDGEGLAYRFEGFVEFATGDEEHLTVDLYVDVFDVDRTF